MSLQVVKSYLMSRNIKKQLLAVDIINNKIVRNEHSINLLLEADVPVLLCDTMNNHYPPLIQKVFLCINKLSNGKKFYKHKHALIIVEATIRILRMLVKDSSEIKTVYYGIKLLCVLLPRLEAVEDIADIGQLLFLVHEILFTPMLQNVHINTIVVVRYILNGKCIAKDEMTLLLMVIKQIFEIIQSLNKHYQKKLYKHITLFCDIVRLSLRLIFSSFIIKNTLLSLYCVKAEHMTRSTLSENILSQLENQLWNIVKDIIAPHLKILSVNKCHSGFVKRYLICLLELYNKLNPSQLNQLSHYFAANSCLVKLPKVNEYFRSTELAGHVNKLLVEILTNLSKSSLCDKSEINNKELYQLLYKGLAILPFDTSKWSQVLTNSSSRSAQYAVIIYIYFMVQSSSSPAVSYPYLPALCQFLISLKNPLPTLLLKALWFNFSVSSLSYCYKEMQNRDLFRHATSILIQMLSWEKKISSVYTHHPSLLYWAFNTPLIKSTFQNKLVNQWLSFEGKESYTEMERLALKNDIAAFSLLEVLCYCGKQVAEKATKILKKLISYYKVKSISDFSLVIWESLPHTLSTFNSSESNNKDILRGKVLGRRLYPGRMRISWLKNFRNGFLQPPWSLRAIVDSLIALNISCLIYLACEYIPQEVDISIFLRISFHVLSIIRQPQSNQEILLLLQAQIFSLAYHLIILTADLKDYRVVKMFLADANIVQTAADFIGSKELCLSKAALKFLAYLIYYQDHLNFMARHSINLNEKLLLYLMISNHGETLVSSLHLMTVVLKTKLLKPILYFCETFTVHLIQFLYLNLQALCTQACEKSVSASWACQRALLQFCARHKNLCLCLHLITQPWTYFVVLFNLNRKTVNNRNFMNYINTWMNIINMSTSKKRIEYREYGVCPKINNRVLCQDQLSLIVTKITEQFLSDKNVDQHIQLLRQEIVKKMLTIDVNIPVSTLNKLKKLYESQEKYKYSSVCMT